MLTKIDNYLEKVEKYACVFVLYSMYYLIILLVWEIITRWVIITLK